MNATFDNEILFSIDSFGHLVIGPSRSLNHRVIWPLSHFDIESSGDCAIKKTTNPSVGDM